MRCYTSGNARAREGKGGQWRQAGTRAAAATSQPNCSAGRVPACSSSGSTTSSLRNRLWRTTVYMPPNTRSLLALVFVCQYCEYCEYSFTLARFACCKAATLL